MFFRAARHALVASACGFVACGTSTSTTEDDDVLPGRVPEERPDGDAASPDDASAPPDATDAAADAASTVPAYCALPNLIACFTFEGAVVDHSPQAHVTSAVQNVSFAPGKHGDALVLSAASAVRFPPATSWNGANVTIEAWIRPSQVTSDMFVLDVDQRYAVVVRDNGELRCIGPGGNADGGVVGTGGFTHVACVFSAGSVAVYTGGIQRDLESSGTGSALGAGTSIGSDAPSGSPFLGAIDSLRIFRVARSAAEIAQDAAQ